LHQRSRKSNGLEMFPPAVLRVHEQFTDYIDASSTAKVEIVYGKTVRNHILLERSIKVAVLPLPELPCISFAKRMFQIGSQSLLFDGACLWQLIRIVCSINPRVVLKLFTKIRLSIRL
jgi:hypothetical protein